MAKRKKVVEENDLGFYKKLAEDTGGHVLKGLGDSKYFIDSGNLALNYVCSGKFMGGGLPTGIIEVYGPEASAKTLLALTAAGQCQRMGGYVVLFDCERASNERFAVLAGHVNPDQLIVQQPCYIEEVEKKIRDITTLIRKEKGDEPPIMFIWDSIGVTCCHREWREMNLPSNYTAADYKKIVGGKEQPGERAKAAGKFFRIINPFISDNNASLFIINQIREKIGVMYGSPETTAGGGRGLPYYANCRLRSSASKKIEDKKRDIRIGVKLSFANKKSRSFMPFLKTEGVQMFFDRGINPLGGLLTMLIAAGRVEGKGNYKINEPWAGGQEIKFKANKENNMVPLEVLKSNPSLVDAETAEELEEYLSVFQDAIDTSSADYIEESDLNSDEDEKNVDDYESKIDEIIANDSK